MARKKSLPRKIYNPTNVAQGKLGKKLSCVPYGEPPKFERVKKLDIFRGAEPPGNMNNTKEKIPRIGAPKRLLKTPKPFEPGKTNKKNPTKKVHFK